MRHIGMMQTQIGYNVGMLDLQNSNKTEQAQRNTRSNKRKIMTRLM